MRTVIKSTTTTIQRNSLNPWARVDHQISMLEMVGADMTAILTKAKIRQLHPYSSNDIRELDRLSLGNTFVPATSI